MYKFSFLLSILLFVSGVSQAADAGTKQQQSPDFNTCFSETPTGGSKLNCINEVISALQKDATAKLKQTYLQNEQAGPADLRAGGASTGAPAGAATTPAARFPFPGGGNPAARAPAAPGPAPVQSPTPAPVTTPAAPPATATPAAPGTAAPPKANVGPYY